MYQNQPPLQGMANNMATYGRYGDSMLVHMNPAEVQGIAALSPTGSLTTNPVTGQPEAFLPFLAPLLGSMFGSSLLAGSTLGGLVGGGLSSAAAGAIGSGLATTLATGDVKKGLLSGITGFGLGKALGSAFDTTSGVQAAQAGVDVAEEGLQQAIKTAGETAGQAVLPGSAAAQNLTQVATQEAALDAAKGGVGDAIRGLGPAGRASAITGNLGTVGKSLIQPMNLAAIGTGEGKIAEIDARELAERNNRRFEEEKKAEYDRATANMEGAFDQLEQDYSGYTIPRMGAGGVTSINPQHYADNIRGLQELAGAPVQMFPGGEIPVGGRGGGGNYNFAPTGRAGSGARQAGIRGTEVISAEELQGTRPGFQSEINYFRKPTAATDTGSGAGSDAGAGSVTQFPKYNVDLSGVDFSNIDLSNLGLGGFNISDYLSTPEGDATVGTIDDVLDVESAPVVGGRGSPGPGSEPIDPVSNIPVMNYEDIVAETTRSTGPIGGPGRSFESEPQVPYETIPSTPPVQAAPPPATTSPIGRGPAIGAGGIMDVGRTFEPEIREMPIDMQLPPALEVPQSIQPAPTPIMQTLPNQRISDPPRSDPAQEASTFLDELTPTNLLDKYNNSPAAQDFSLNATYDPETGLYTEDLSSFGFTGDSATKTYTRQEFMDKLGYGLEDSASTPPPPPSKRGPFQTVGRKDPSSPPPPPKRGSFQTVGRKDPPTTQDPEPISPPKRRGSPRRGGRNMREGGEVELSAMNETLESNGQLLIERAVEAISGQLSEEQASAVVASFIDEFGPEAFQMLREKVLNQIVPGSQKEGEIRGAGGGMDDMIPGMIGNSQPVAVSPGEYIIPADVVSGLGDGSTDAGVGELDQMLDRVRQERTGTLRQPAPMRVGGVLPA